MKIQCRGLLLSVLVMSLLIVASLTAQTPETNNRQDKIDAVKLNIDLVTLDAQVLRQKTDRIAWKLKQDDFVLYEDGIKQKITNFSQDTLPLSVILLIDRVGCLDPFRDDVKNAVKATLQQLKPEDEVAVMSFSTEVEVLSGFQANRSKTVAAFEDMPHIDSLTGHCFNRAFFEAARYMRTAANPNGRRVIIMISGISEGANCSGPSTEKTTTEVLESGSTVCGVLVRASVDITEHAIKHGIAGVAKAVGVGAINVKSLVEETGGETIEGNPKNLEFKFDNLMTRIRTRYAIGYVSSNAKRDGTYRKLKVQIAPGAEKREGKLVVRTRRGYIAVKDNK